MSEFWNRAWKLNVTDRTTSLAIIELDESVNLRFNFSITLTTDLFLNYGEIKLYNMSKSIRDALHYRSLVSGFSKGNNVDLSVGYGGIKTIIFSGSIHNCYSKQEGADVVTILDVGTKAGNVLRKLQTIKKEVLISPASIATQVKNILSNILTDSGVGQTVPIVPDFISKCTSLLTANQITKLSYSITPAGTIQNIINYLNDKLQIFIYRNNTGAIDVIAEQTTKAPVVNNSFPALDIGVGFGVVGYPVDYGTGVKFRSLIRTDINFFQKINFTSKFISRTLVVKKSCFPVTLMTMIGLLTLIL